MRAVAGRICMDFEFTCFTGRRNESRSGARSCPLSPLPLPSPLSIPRSIAVAADTCRRGTLGARGANSKVE